MILTILTVVPIAIGLILLALPVMLPRQASARVESVSRNISMGVAMALFAVTTWVGILNTSEFGNSVSSWTGLSFGDYVLYEAPIDLVPTLVCLGI